MFSTVIKVLYNRDYKDSDSNHINNGLMDLVHNCVRDRQTGVVTQFNQVATNYPVEYAVQSPSCHPHRGDKPNSDSGLPQLVHEQKTNWERINARLAQW